MSANGNSNPPSDKPSATQPSSSGSDLSKDQVGWYFVEQYYNTVSKNPDKLHLFYAKNSKFVYGVEAEVAKIAVGRQAIQERIRQLDFLNCKVRISNVDSQASFDNIVIQVIGEFSNKGGEPKKFVQTFILAQQPSGYFVLNDILRLIDDDDADDEAAEPQANVAPADTAADPSAAAAAPVDPVKDDEPASDAAPSAPLDAVHAGKKSEHASDINRSGEATGPEPVPEGTTMPEFGQDASESADHASDAPETDAAAAREVVDEDVKEADKPQEPAPAPATKSTPQEPEKAAAPTPAPASVPVKPMTWASRVAATTPRPVVPLKAATPPAPSQTLPTPAPAPPTQPAQSVQTSQAAQPAQPADAPAPARKDANEWQTAGEGSKRQNRPQSMAGPSGDKESASCYVKYVSDKVQNEELKAALSVHGEITYCDINRGKNCAFVEFTTVQGSQSAIAASPYNINGETIQVEARRKPGGYGGGYGSGRGGMSGRGRGGYDGSRSSSQRGSYSAQPGRGRGSTRGSRGAAQVGSS